VLTTHSKLCFVFKSNRTLSKSFVFFILGPAIILWDWLPGSGPYYHRSCESPFAKNFPYLVTTAFVEFFVPFFSLTTLNLLVYMNIRQRSRGLIRTNTIRLKPNGYHSNTLDSSIQKDREINSSTSYTKPPTSTSLARDRKAAKNLFILVFAFVICWCPYTLLTLIRALCTPEDKYISSFVYEITFWLLWLNSTINPLLYSFLHVKFRKAFHRILCFYSIKHRHRMRTDRI
jgi:histamine receptor H3